MHDVKQKMSPGVIGCAVSLMLIASFFITNFSFGSLRIQAINNVLVIAVMCAVIHLVRRTSALNNTHVWDDPALVFIWCIPVFNLLITAIQFFGGIFSQILTGYFFTVIMILFSLPLFFVHYFVYIPKKVFDKDGFLKVTMLLLCIVTGIYAVLRICDKVIFPICLTEERYVPELLIKIAGFSSWLALLLDVISLAGFVRLSALLRKNEENLCLTTSDDCDNIDNA